MNDSLLTNIENYIKENNIQFLSKYDNIAISFNIMPEEFRQVAVSFVTHINSKTNGVLDNFLVRFDKNKNAYIEIADTAGKTKLLITKRNVVYDKTLIGYKLYEDKFLDNVDILDKMKMQKAMIHMPSRWFKSYDDVAKLSTVVSHNSDLICGYMSYLDEEYKRQLEQQKIVISYNQPEQATNSVVMHSKSDNTIKISERVNEEISLEDRLDVLESHEYLYSALANDQHGLGSKYHIYLYGIADNTSRLIMEPEDGKKYTKIAYYGETLDKEGFIDLAITSLEKNRDEVTYDDLMSRHCHTTLDNYRKLVGYVVKQDGVLPPYSSKASVDKSERILKIK